MEEIEYSIVLCKHCGMTKKRVMDGRYSNGKDIRWVDENTRKQWSGHVCSVCVVEKARKRKQAKSRSKKLNEQ